MEAALVHMAWVTCTCARAPLILNDTKPVFKNENSSGNSVFTQNVMST